MANRILGLDLGSASIGWALISVDQNESKETTQIIDLGCRIIPYEGNEGKDFSKGTGESRNSQRTRARAARRGYDRYQLRRKFLIETLRQHQMLPDESLVKLNKLDLWKLRANASSEQISLKELGRVLLLLNQKRGYKSSRKDNNSDKKDTDYVAHVKSRHNIIREQKITIGHFFYNHLLEDEFYRIKENVFPRDAYIEEYNQICKTQQKYHTTLTTDLINKIRDEIIYYQRPLKSQKGLVSVCEFEGFWVKKENKEYFVGPKVAHKSSPIFQAAKIWENVNNIRLTNNVGQKIELTLEEKKSLFNHLDNNEKLSDKDILRIIGLKKEECYLNKQLTKGLKGNITKQEIKKCFPDRESYNDLLSLNLTIDDKPGTESCLYDSETGELLSIKSKKEVSRLFENETLHKLWHTIYSITDIEECSKVLQNNFHIDKNTADKLALIDFTRYGYGNKSVKALRKILPYLMEGDVYSEAMSYAGYNHSGSLTKEENLKRIVLEKLKPIPNNSLRQPIVEKILNQMVNLINSIIEKHGKPDEIRVELARELKQSKDERSKTEKRINEIERENERIRKSLEEYGLRATRNNIIKWRLYEEMSNDEKKLNATCIYCGDIISLTDAIKGDNVDIEHIIPKSKLFDDSQSNKTLAHRSCNSTKGNLTAHDFMKGKPDHLYQEYVIRVNNLYKNNLINKSKRDKLLMSENDIPQNFIDRQLRESQYISKKAREILGTICHNVWSTSGTVTSELRHLWGWDDITMNLQFNKYSQVGLIETVTWESNHGKNLHEKEVIKGWTKRDDHRHHAIDALTVACTKQKYIHRLNTLNAQKTKEEIKQDLEKFPIEIKDKLSPIQKYFISQQPLSVKEVEDSVANILISIKAGKKVATKATRKIGRRGHKRVVQREIVVPRGALSEESVYGKIKVIEKNKPLKYLFDNTDLIVKDRIRQLILDRISQHNNNAKKALSSIKKNPIFLDSEKTVPLEYGSCFKEEYVIKYSVDTNFNKTEKVIDPVIKTILENRLEKFNNKPREAFKDVKIDDNSVIPWYKDEGLDKPILTVRCKTGLTAVVPVKKAEDGSDIGFVKPGNNHHVAIYRDLDGNLFEHVCTYWNAVERKKLGLPVIIKDTNKVWDHIQGVSDKYPQSFLEQLPPPNSILEISIQQNEMFILGIPTQEVESCIAQNDYKTISEHLYRVQKLGSKDYTFRHHLETQLIDNNEALTSKRFYRTQSLTAFTSLHPYKVSIDITGKIKS